MTGSPWTPGEYLAVTKHLRLRREDILSAEREERASPERVEYGPVDAYHTIQYKIQMRGGVIHAVPGPKMTAEALRALGFDVNEIDI